MEKNGSRELFKRVLPAEKIKTDHIYPNTFLTRMGSGMVDIMKIVNAERIEILRIAIIIGALKLKINLKGKEISKKVF